MNERERTPLLVLGLGNVLCRDDGVGPAAIARLRREAEPAPGVELADGGTLGLALLPLVEDAERVLILDAVRQAGAAPGTFVRLDGDDVASAVRERLSVHQVGVADVLDALTLRGAVPQTFVLLGLVPAEVGLGFGLTPAVAAGLDRLLDETRREAAALGFPFAAVRSGDAAPEARHARGALGL